MVVVILILTVSSFLFSSDVQRLVVAPLTKMKNFVQKMQMNPLRDFGEELGEKDTETSFVTGALKRFIRLLQVALGAAGAPVLAHNLREEEFTALVPGK